MIDLLVTLLTFVCCPQVQDVLDGDLDPFIATYLRTSAEGKKSKVNHSGNMDALYD